MPIHIVNNIWPAFGNNLMQMFIERLNEPPEHPKHANPNALLHTASHTHCDGVISAVFGQNRTYWAPTRVHVDRLPTPTYIPLSVVCTLYHCHLPLLVAVCDYYMECTEAKVLSLSLTLSACRRINVSHLIPPFLLSYRYKYIIPQHDRLHDCFVMEQPKPKTKKKIGQPTEYSNSGIHT